MAAALINDKFIFGTLDAKLVALDQKSGKVVWTKEIGDFKAGYSLLGRSADRSVEGARPAVPQRRFGRRIRHRWPRRSTQRRQPAKSSGRVRPSKATSARSKGKDFDDDRQEERKLAGRPVEDRRRRNLARRHFDAETGLVFFGTGNPAPWNSHMRPGDNKWSCARIAIDR